MFRRIRDFYTTFVSNDWTLRDKEPEQLLTDQWVKDHYYNCNVHDDRERLCSIIEYLIASNASLSERMDRLSALTGMLVDVVRESPKPSMLVHPNPLVRELFTLSKDDLEKALKDLYGVPKDPYDN